jgi:hypothetical protein
VESVGLSQWIAHNLVSRLAHDEISAVNGLCGLRSLESRYGTAHPSMGFTCDFALLETESAFGRDPAHDGLLFSDPFEGYKFSLTGCEADTEGEVYRFPVTLGLPVAHGSGPVKPLNSSISCPRARHGHTSKGCGDSDY